LSSATSHKCHFPLVPVVRGVMRKRLSRTAALHTSVDESDTYPCLRLVRRRWITWLNCCEHTAPLFAGRIAQRSARKCTAGAHFFALTSRWPSAVGAVACNLRGMSHCVTLCCARGGELPLRSRGRVDFIQRRARRCTLTHIGAAHAQRTSTHGERAHSPSRRSDGQRCCHAGCGIDQGDTHQVNALHTWTPKARLPRACDHDALCVADPL